MDKLVRQAMEELGVDVPVYRWRVVGSRVELFLYGRGEPLHWEGKGIEGLTVVQLRALAKELGLKVPAGMKKVDLIEVCKEAGA